MMAPELFVPLLAIAIFGIFIALVVRGRTIGNKAVEIAQDEGWVSPHRLKTRCGYPQADAKIGLESARRRGLLVRGAKGRYYLPSKD